MSTISSMFSLAGVWQWSLEQLHVRLPSQLPQGLMVKHAVLLLVAGFALQQLSGQLWRVFVSGVSGQVSLIEDISRNMCFGR